MNTNKIIRYITVGEDQIAAKEGKSKIPRSTQGIRENLSIEAYSVRDRSCHD